MSEYIHFSWHASTPLWAGDRRLERGHPHVKKINVFDKREQRKLACAMPCKEEEDEVN